MKISEQMPECLLLSFTPEDNRQPMSLEQVKPKLFIKKA
ncbi:hypothetical protein FHR96_004045 [Halomonas organivorans]|uniref:Uncharacterized protein n=1 Tax=Halomonas organivorans TaxID=257772 RepID=A0A7W5C203_9GAMM|nr:hypothetical protein [Halomonas organivorans]